MHGNLMPTLLYELTILERDYVDVKRMFTVVNNSSQELCPLAKLSLPSVCDSRNQILWGELITVNNMPYNLTAMGEYHVQWQISNSRNIDEGTVTKVQ